VRNDDRVRTLMGPCPRPVFLTHLDSIKERLSERKNELKKVKSVVIG